MKLLIPPEAEREFQQALAALEHDNTVSALAHLEKGLRIHNDPSMHSYLGYCIARERGQSRKGIELCTAALALEPENPAHFLNLGKIHVLCKNKDEAMRVFRQGLAFGSHPEIVRMLTELGMRKPPLFPWLKRSNPLNRYLGLLLSRLGLR